MKRFVAVWTLCGALSLGSFGVLLFEDRTLDVPLPYSLPIAFASMLILTPVLLVLGRQIGGREVVREPRADAVQPPRLAAAVTIRRRTPEGVVLLDFSGMNASEGRRA